MSPYTNFTHQLPYDIHEERLFSIFYKLFKKGLLASKSLSFSHNQSNSSISLSSEDNDGTSNFGEHNSQSEWENDLIENPSNMLFKFIVEGLGITIFTILGVIGNILSMFVLTRRRMLRKSINILLLGLAISDTVFILFAMTSAGLPTICDFINFDITRSYLGVVLPFMFPVGFSALTTSVYFTIAVTVERYLAMSNPFQARSYCTPQKAKYFATCIVLLTSLYNGPRWLEYTYVVITDYDDGDGPYHNHNLTMDPESLGGRVIIRYLTVTTSLRRNPTYDKYYILIGFSTIIFILPIIVLLVLNILIYHNVKRANTHRKSLSKSQKNENSLAFMLIIIVTIFIVCNSVSVLDALVKFITNYRNHNLETLRNFVVVANSSVNFFIYCVYGESFRGSFFDMIPGWVKRLKCCCCCCSNVLKVSDRNDSLIIRRPSMVEMNTGTGENEEGGRGVRGVVVAAAAVAAAAAYEMNELKIDN